MLFPKCGTSTSDFLTTQKIIVLGIPIIIMFEIELFMESITKDTGNYYVNNSNYKLSIYLQIICVC